MMSLSSLATLKVIFTGEIGVGKSSLLLRFTDDTFYLNPRASIGVDFKIKKLIIQGNHLRLALWDTAGHEKFRTLSPNYYRGSQGIVFVYDVTNRSSLYTLTHWIIESDKYIAKGEAVKLLVGNKIDKVGREVTRKEGSEFARKHSMIFIESSAKTKEGVMRIFEEFLEKIIETPGLWVKNDPDAFALESPAIFVAGGRSCTSC